MPRRILLLAALLLAQYVFAQSDQMPDDSSGWPCAKKIDPSYIQVAEGSGGQVLMLDPSEAGNSMVLMESQLRGIEETVFRAGGTLEGKRDYSIPVDSTIEAITFSVFIQCIESIRIVLPDGSEFKAGQGGPNDHVFRSGRVFSLDAPVSGIWHVQVTGKGFHSVLVQAKTEVGFDFDFVAPGGRPGHEGIFPTHEIPRIGAEQMLQLNVSGAQEVEVALISASLQEISRVKVDESIPSGEDSEILATTRIPQQPFRVRIQGQDAKGFQWQRIDGRLWTPQRAKE